jgi:hypothetical protein
MHEPAESRNPKAAMKESPVPSPRDEARLALLARLSQIPQRSEPSLQPTPEAAKSRTARIRRKRRQLILQSKRVTAASDRIPPRPDSLAP